MKFEKLITLRLPKNVHKELKSILNEKEISFQKWIYELVISAMELEKEELSK